MTDHSPEYRPSAASAPRNRLVSVLRDPLTHFLAIGVAIFVLAQAFAPRDESGVMRVDESVYGEIVDIFAAARGRAPTEAEMADLAERWLVDETLYREALARGIDEGDTMIRERINQKMRILVQSSAVPETPEAGDIRAHFEENRAEFGTPSRISFSIARIDGDRGEAEDWAHRLDTGTPGPDGPQVYDIFDRPRPSLVSVFGDPFVTRLEDLPQGNWRAVETPNGWQAVRIEEIVPGRTADYEAVRERVRSDWEAQAARDAQTRAMEALIAGYEVVVEPYDPARFQDRAAQAALNDPVVE